MRLQVGATVITWGHDDHGPFVVTTLSDGAETIARPIDEVWEETRLHDPLHALLAAAIDGAESQTLWRVAHGLPCDTDDVRREEARVLMVQRAIRDAEADHPPTHSHHALPCVPASNGCAQ